MATNEYWAQSRVPEGFVLAPIHCPSEGAPLRLCVLVNAQMQPGTDPFVLLREIPGSRVYLGAVCDATARIQEWVEVWVQTLELRDLSFSGYQERLSNHVFDERWQVETMRLRNNLPEHVIVTGMEETNPGPILIKRSGQKESTLASSEASAWKLCKDDALLQSFGLPPYSTSPFRYLHELDVTGPKTFLAVAVDAPTNSHVQGIDRLRGAAGVRAVFNVHAGFVRVTRYSPLDMEEYLQILEGRPWNPATTSAPFTPVDRLFASLQGWSTSPKGLPFLMHGMGTPADRLNEIFFIKLSALRDMLKAVRNYTKERQYPLLNLSPASFRLFIPSLGDQFPSLWASKCVLVKPSQAYALTIPSTEQKYFIRLGRIETSPYLPEGFGAHSFGIGSIRIRNVLAEQGGTVIEGTLVAEDYLGLESHDLLWFRLPLNEERLEFYAHVYKEAMGPKEARFRTVPTKLSDPVVAALKRAAGTVFPRSPYEIWPLLSSPSDLFSMGVVAVRVLLANSQSNLPVVLDEILSLSRYLGKETGPGADVVASVKSLLAKDKRLLDLVSPHALTESSDSPAQARAAIRMDLWIETIALLLRLFPGAGTHSFCQNFGHVSPLALETAFDEPLRELDELVWRLRSTIVPTLAAHEEIASVILESLARV